MNEEQVAQMINLVAELRAKLQTAAGGLDEGVQETLAQMDALLDGDE